THRELVDALRNARSNAYDAVILADFEKPGLLSAVCQQKDFPIYIEVSLGGQHAALVHPRLKVVHVVSLPLEARLNYYESFEWLLDWLGVQGRRADRYSAIVRRPPGKPESPFRLFVSPFTSKHEPSLTYWSNLLALVSDCGAGALEFCVDAGV